MRKVRQSVARLERAGYTFEAVTAADVGGDLRAELERVSRIWRGANAERGFSMAMDDPFREPDTVFVLARRGGSIGGFLHLVPSARGYSLGAMRRDPVTPNGLMEYLIVQTLAWAHGEGADELSLNFCVFSDLLAIQRGGCRWRRVACFEPATAFSSSSASCASAGSSLPSGGHGTSVWSGSPTFPPWPLPTCGSSRCSRRPAPGRGARRCRCSTAQVQH